MVTSLPSKINLVVNFSNSQIIYLYFMRILFSELEHFHYLCLVSLTEQLMQAPCSQLSDWKFIVSNWRFHCFEVLFAVGDSCFFLCLFFFFFFCFPDVKLGFESAFTGLYFEWKVLITVIFKNPSGVPVSKTWRTEEVSSSPLFLTLVLFFFKREMV